MIYSTKPVNYRTLRFLSVFSGLVFEGIAHRLGNSVQALSIDHHPVCVVAMTTRGACFLDQNFLIGASQLLYTSADFPRELTVTCGFSNEKPAVFPNKMMGSQKPRCALS